MDPLRRRWTYPFVSTFGPVSLSEGGARAVGVLKLVAARDMPRISSWSNKIKQIFQDGSKDGLRNKERCVKMKRCVQSEPWAMGWGIGIKGIFRDGSKDGLRNREICGK